MRKAIDTALEAAIAPSFTRIGHDVRSRLFDWTPIGDHRGRTVLVTGATSGLGLAAAVEVARTGARVTFLARNELRAQQAKRQIVEASGNDDVWWSQADLADLDSVRAFAAAFQGEHDRLDALVHNAGALLAERVVTTDGMEFTHQTQVVAPALLTHLLRPQLARAGGRVVFVSSGGMYAEKPRAERLEMTAEQYNGTRAYARAKRAQLGVMHELARSLAPDGITVNAMHPGWADTPGVEESLPVFRRIVGPLLRTPQQGADTIVWLALSDEAADRSGEFFHDRASRPEHRLPSTRLAADAQAELEARLLATVTAQAGVTEPAW